MQLRGARVGIGFGLALAFAVAACGAHPAAPAWPKLHDRDDDGGESLAPHERSEVAAALEADPPPPPPRLEVSLAPVVQPAAPVQTTVVAPEDTPPIQAEDTVIEIKDDE